jgi:hypothetical protein
MCSWCNTTEGFCFCGSSKDPDDRTEPCGVKSDPSQTCPRCGHEGKAIPADTSSQGSDYVEYG